MNLSNLLWKYYLEDDVEKFRRLLAPPAIQNSQHTSKSYGGGGGSFGGTVGSSGPFATSPKAFMKSRKVSGHTNTLGAKGTSNSLGKSEINSRDHAGLTVLHRAASSTSANAIGFALALLDQPFIDIYIQDPENGWTALHRALYFGNITIAARIVEKDRREPSGPTNNAGTRTSIIKIKDHEGNSAFDVYNATIARRSLQQVRDAVDSDDGSDDSESIAEVLGESTEDSLLGDELFMFGSNKNHSLGFGDGDDRQHPERIALKRPDHLLFRFYREYLEVKQSSSDASEKSRLRSTPKVVTDLPSLVQNRPVIIHDVALSKLHSAILTCDPEANLYMCGFGPGGRLGTGDEVTRSTFTCVEEGGLLGKKITKVALGQNHSLAVSSDGEVFSWGTSTYGQLGYSLPKPALKDEEPVCATPRQIFGPLKRESIVGVAASAVHSVAYSSTSLFCWGKNDGQLGLMDSDSRSLAVQSIPRKVAASLFKAQIMMVAAINGATICLLANHTVCVFTNYGYNMVKFPLDEEFTNYHLRSTLTTNYDAASNHISYITAGGDTIAAVSSRGDLFTLGVRKIDSDGSTTNPSKIKSALSPPQRIWSLRKGQWDGIKSVGVAENGSIIICTHAGAVWRRVKRAKMKDAFTSSTELSRKDFKFQRVPGLTKVTAVRSTTFGVFAAVRRDCDITRSQVSVEKESLCENLKPLLSICEIDASQLPQEAGAKPSTSFTAHSLDPIKRAVLSSHDIEGDVSRYLSTKDLKDYDIEVCTSTSEVGVPAHGFMLAARSSILRNAMQQYRQTGSSSVSDVLVVEKCSNNQRAPGRPAIRVVFHGLDFISVLNLVVWCYSDTIVDVWHFTRKSPNMAFRYRQIRVELMKLASHLKMTKLEVAVRLMTEPEKCMSSDMEITVRDPDFFDDGDTIIELNGGEQLSHSSLLCQRCPFFEGLFKGRSGGQWLAGRREFDPDHVRVDLKHVEPDTFDFVLRYLYADAGTELFDDVVTDDIDDFSEIVMDVMSIADELMLDRLAQVCQEVIGRFVNTRNISQLLNVIAPCAITEFKDAALEYICLQLECMLENHLIDDLDEDLLLDLDEVVRGNQLNCLPFAKSGRAELLLHERNPDLAEELDDERQRRIRDNVFRANLKDEDGRLSTSLQGRFGSLEDAVSASPRQDKLRRKSKTFRNAPFSPSIRPSDSTVDLMFDMEDDELIRPKSPPVMGMPGMPTTSRKASTPWGELEPAAISDPSYPQQNKTPPSALTNRTWSSPALGSIKLDMRDIMAQASSSRVSNLSMSLSAQKHREENGNKSATKLSQKDRKKQQQQAIQKTLSQPQITVEKPDGKPSSPWQVANTGPKTSLKDVLGDPSPIILPAKSLGSPIPSRSLTPRRAASPDTRFAGQSRNNKSSKAPQLSTPSSSQPASRSTSAPIIPHSKSYHLPTAYAEPSLQLTMEDIIGQQLREQEVIKEAVAKRSLQEIQEEQAFQEWWALESRRVQEEEAARTASTNASKGGKNNNGKGKGRGRGRGRGGGRGGAAVGS